MTFCRPHLKDLVLLASLAFMAPPLAVFTCPAQSAAQALNRSSASVSSTGNTVSDSSSTLIASSAGFGSSGPDRVSSVNSAEPDLSLPEAPEPAEPSGNPERENITASGVWNQPPFSRIGIGADVSPLGIGIKSAIVLDRFFDA